MWDPDIEDTGGPAFQRIADAIAADIASGRLKRGERLPTQRALANLLGVAIGTVSRAYDDAARRGLISCEIGRGSFVRHAERVPGVVRRFDVWAQSADAPSAADAVELSVNWPVTVGAAEQELLDATLASIRTAGGLSDLFRDFDERHTRQQRGVAAEWLRTFGVHADAERVFLCAGAQHALTAITSVVTQPGDVVLTEALTYPGMKARAAMLHVRLVGLPMDRNGILPDAFAAACKEHKPRALYTVPTMQMPTASVMPVERRREIAAIAARYNVLIIEDDDDTFLLPDAPPPIAAVAPEQTLYVADTSKAIAPGLRLAYLVAPPGWAERLDAAVRITVWYVSPLVGAFAARWIGDGAMARMRDLRRSEISARQRLAMRRFGARNYQTHPFGHHLWLELPEPWRGEAFVAAAVRRGSRVAAAENFVVGRRPAPHAIGICLGPPVDRPTLERGLDAIADLLRSGPDAEPAYAR